MHDMKDYDKVKKKAVYARMQAQHINPRNIYINM